jgi:hypothetical protein
MITRIVAVSNVRPGHVVTMPSAGPHLALRLMSDVELLLADTIASVRMKRADDRVPAGGVARGVHPVPEGVRGGQARDRAGGRADNVDGEGRREGAMQNVTMRIDGNKLVIEVDLTKEIGPSSSGKTMLIASTEGNANVPGFDGVKVGLNVYKAKK